MIASDMEAIRVFTVTTRNIRSIRSMRRWRRIVTSSPGLKNLWKKLNMTQSNYTPINECFECLEHFLLLTDFGFSNSAAGLVAGLYHVTENKNLFPKLVRAFLRSRAVPRIEQ